MQLIHNEIRQIRDLINESWKHSQIRKSPTSKQTGNPFLRMASALDVLGDTEAIIETFIAFRSENTNALTLQIYGVLQALFLQQEAVESLSIALFNEGINFENDHPKLHNIRDIRNKSIGHPTFFARKTKKSHIFTSTFAVKQGHEFRMIEYFDDGTHITQIVDLDKLIDEQSKEMLSILQKTTARIWDQKKEHRLKYQGEKLSRIFDNLVYAHEKLHMAVVDEATEANRQMGLLFGVGEFEDAFNRFLEAIVVRDSEMYSKLRDSYKPVVFALKQLNGYCEIENPSLDRVNQPTAEIFAHYVTDQFEKLQAYAREIDAEYDSIPEIDDTNDDEIIKSLQLTAHITRSGKIKFDPTQDWEVYVDATYGILVDDPIERPEELPADKRDDIE